jgi:DNA-binding transcriptional regulator GbsR (MarR family)
MSAVNEVDEFAEQTAATLAAAGFPRMAARVMMMLMTEESGSATAEHLAERLGASAAAISGAVRYLQSLSIIRRQTMPGSRRHRYELPEHVWYATSSSQAPLYTHLVALAEKGSAALPVGSKARERTVEMADYFRFMRERLPQLLEEWQATRS